MAWIYHIRCIPSSPNGPPGFCSLAVSGYSHHERSSTSFCVSMCFHFSGLYTQAWNCWLTGFIIFYCETIIRRYQSVFNNCVRDGPFPCLHSYCWTTLQALLLKMRLACGYQPGKCLPRAHNKVRIESENIWQLLEQLEPSFYVCWI